MSKAYIQHRADFANEAALQAHQIATLEFVVGSIVVCADESVHICVDPDDATSPFVLFTVT